MTEQITTQFESWQYRINIISHVHGAYDYSGLFGVFRGNPGSPGSPDKYGLIQELCKQLNVYSRSMHRDGYFLNTEALCKHCDRNRICISYLYVSALTIDIELFYMP